MRLYVDYRRLNSATVADSYPLSRIDDLLHAAKATKYMITLDLRSGYHQVRLSLHDINKFAFTTGRFRYLRLPFGLRNALARFQCLNFCKGLQFALMLINLNDFVILLETFDDHLNDLHKVFCVNREKCSFASDRVMYFGHIISGNIHKS